MTTSALLIIDVQVAIVDGWRLVAGSLVESFHHVPGVT